MNVLVSINRGYLRHFRVMLFSLEQNARERLAVYVLHDDLIAEDFAENKRLFPEIEFNYVEMDIELCRGFPTVKRYPFTVYYRIFAPLILPKTVDRILYLDCDLVLHNCIDGFYNTDFEGNLFVACSNTGAFLNAFNRVRLGVRRDYVYMNTGVLLMNVAMLRDAIDVNAIREYTIRHKAILALYDQDILCRFFGNRVKKADKLVYNLSDRHYRLQNLFHAKRIDEKWVEENNVIAHYIGKNKPWKKGYKGVLGKYYHSFAKRLDSASGTKGEV